MRQLFSLLLISFNAQGMVLFSTPETPIQIKIQANFTKINSIKNSTYNPYDFEVKGSLEFDNSSYPLKIRPRGNSRIKYCDGMKPLKLDFKKSNTPSFLKGLNDKIKLVTHCDLNPSETSDWDKLSPNQRILIEFYRYQVLALIRGEYALRAQLVEVSYEDTDSGKQTSGLGIFLEHKSDLEKRLGIHLFPVDEETPIASWEISERLRGKSKFWIEKQVHLNRKKKEVEAYLGDDITKFKVDMYLDLRTFFGSWDITVRDNNLTLKGSQRLRHIAYDFDYPITNWHGVMPRRVEHLMIGNKVWLKKHFSNIDKKNFSYLLMKAGKLLTKKEQVLSYIQSSNHPYKLAAHKRSRKYFNFLETVIQNPKEMFEFLSR